MIGSLPQYFVGEEAMSKRGICKISRPIESSIVSNFDDLDIIYSHGFKDVLSCDPQSHPAIVSEF